MRKTILVLALSALVPAIVLAAPPSGKIGAMKPVPGQVRPVNNADRQLLDAAEFVGAGPRVQAALKGSKMFEPSGGEGGTRQLTGASALFKQCVPSVVALIAPDGSSLGSGTVVDDQGTILTNWHVVQGQTEMFVLFYDPQFASFDDVAKNDYERADVIAMDKHRDLALVHLRDLTKAHPVQLGNEANLEVAADVFAIGHPHQQLWTFTYGVISAIRPKYDWSYGEGTAFKAEIIQTQTPINPGNSGGPLFNDKGELIGVNSFCDAKGQGLNYAVHIAEFRPFIEEGKQGKFPVVIDPPAAQETSSQTTAGSGNQGAGGDAGVAADQNGDGVTDAWCYDTNKNGKFDVFMIDANQDGKTDYIVTDLDENQVPDMYMYDDDQNGAYEHWYSDSDGDGKLDTEAWDDNGDLKADRQQPYLPK